MKVLMINGSPHAKGNTYLALQEMARNMTFLMKSIALGKEQFGLPQKEAFAPMNFIRQQGDGSYET